MTRQEILRLTTECHQLAMGIRWMCDNTHDVNKGRTVKETLKRVREDATKIENLNGAISHPDKYPPMTE